MRRRADLRRVTRSLRFQLTASFALFFAVMLIGFTGLFRERLVKTLSDQSQELLNQEWSTMKGYLHIDRVGTLPIKAFWIYDPSDPDETNSVTQIQKVYLVADADGHAIPEVINDPESNGPAVSSTYEDLGVEAPAVIARRVREALSGKSNTPVYITRFSKSGEAFLIRYGLVYDDRRTSPAPFYVAIGTSLANNDKILAGFTWI